MGGTRPRERGIASVYKVIQPVEKVQSSFIWMGAKSFHLTRSESADNLFWPTNCPSWWYDTWKSSQNVLWSFFSSVSNKFIVSVFFSYSVPLIGAVLHEFRHSLTRAATFLTNVVIFFLHQYWNLGDFFPFFLNLFLHKQRTEYVHITVNQTTIA